MEVIMENVRQYILAFMKAGDFSQKDLADASTVPLETVRHILSGRTGKNAGFATIAKMVVALGGDLNASIGYEKKQEIETNTALSLKETYEARIEELTKSYELRMADQKNFCDLRVADMQKCCEDRIADIRKDCEARLKEQKELLQNFC